jgi:hypothetical protein
MRKRFYRGTSILRTALDKFDLIPRHDGDDDAGSFMSLTDVDLTGALDKSLLWWRTGPSKVEDGPTVSTDGELGAGTEGSDDKVATEKAVKTFIRTVIKGYDPQNSILGFRDMDGNPPVTPSSGDRYISTTTAGDFTINCIYEWDTLADPDAWSETIPVAGFSLTDESSWAEYYYTGSAWIATFGNYVQSGALTLGVTKAPSHDAVYRAVVTKIEYTTSGIDQQLQSPSSAYDLAVNMPIGDDTAASSGNVEVFLGDKRWNRVTPLPPGYYTIPNDPLTVAYPYGSLQFRPASGKVWAQFASAEIQVITINFPKTSDGGVDGGSASFCYVRQYWMRALKGRSTVVTIAQNGSAYAGGISPTTLINTIDGIPGPAGLPVTSSAILYANGYDQNLSMPLDTYSTAANMTLFSSNFAYFNIGGKAWALSGTLGTSNVWAAANYGGAYGAVYFSQGGAGWLDFAPSSSDGLITITVPRLASGDVAGGYVQLYFIRAAFEIAFKGTTSNMILAQNGSVYKGSIASANLVTTLEGLIGPAGQGVSLVPYASVGSGYAALDYDHVLVITGSANETVTLPACASGLCITIKSRTTGVVTVSRAGSDTIDGGAVSLSLGPNQAVTLIGNSTDWTVV